MVSLFDAMGGSLNFLVLAAVSKTSESENMIWDYHYCSAIELCQQSKYVVGQGKFDLDVSLSSMSELL